MANPTTNLSMTKPTVGGSTDTWGTTINEEVVDVVDAVFGSGGTNVSMADVSVDQLTVIAQGDLRLADTTGGQYIAFQAAGTTTSYTLTMPAGVPSADDVLTASDGSGTLSWAAPTTGDLTAIVAGAGLTGTSLSGPVPTLNVIGTADKITVSADAVTIASTYVGQTSITTLGTIATGTWEGTTVAVNQGGTGATSLTDGGVLLGSGTGAITATAVLGDGEILIGDASGDPVALDVGGSTAITILGTVATGVWNGTAVGVAYGGTAISSYAAGDILYASGSTTLAKLAKGSDTQVLTLASGVPTWAAPTVGDITGVTAGTGLSGGGTTGTVTLNVEAAQGGITSVGTLTSLAVGDITSTGNFTTSDTGPHAVGIASADYIQWVQGGAFTSGGATTRAGALVVRTVLTGADGDTAVQCAIGAGTTWGTAITTQANSETIGVVATAHFSDPDITKGTDTVTTAATVYIADAPSEGATNAALYVAAGAVNFQSTLDVTGTITGNLTGNVTGNTSGTAATVTGAAQSAITSVGTLTSLGVGDITSTGVLSIGANPSAYGDIRLKKDFIIATRNNANDANKVCVSENVVTGNDTLDFGDNTKWAALRFHCSSANVMELTSSAINLNKAVTTSGAATVGGNLVVSGVGPNAYGGGVITYVQHHFAGAFTSSGASTTGTSVLLNTVLTGAAADTGSLVSMRLAAGITTQTATESIGYIAQLAVEKPAITDNLTGDITVAASVYIKDAPTAGETNAALYVAAGATDLKGTLAVAGTVGIGESAGAHPLMVTGQTLFTGGAGNFKTNTTASNSTAEFVNSHASAPYGVYVHFSGAAPNDTTSFFLRGQDSGAIKVNIYSDGSYEGAADSYGGISDRRVKNSIEPATDQRSDIIALSKIASNFSLNDGGDKRHLGWIAQDVLEISPGLVTEHPDDDLDMIYGMRTSVLHTKAAIALGQHLTEWDDYRGRIEALEAQMAEILENT